MVAEPRSTRLTGLLTDGHNIMRSTVRANDREGNGYSRPSSEDTEIPVVLRYRRRFDAT
jgi:hypothetical protein